MTPRFFRQFSKAEKDTVDKTAHLIDVPFDILDDTLP